ncbi:alpha-amylase [Myxococcota bacterium]|nr:alpha-amylase [Myxococcota bacterium]
MRSWVWSPALLLVGALVSACSSDGTQDAGTRPDATVDAGTPDSGVAPGLTIDVTGYFAPGETVRDAYSDRTAVVSATNTVTIEPDPSGVLLLEADGAAPTPFTWENALVYFVIPDRFHNGNPANDGSYGRQKDGADETGTWHGGDLAGLTAKLDHIDALGVTAIWITPPVEQVHGWVSGGTGDFKHYAYHGYWALDFTRLDANLGTTDELRAFVDAAHARGIRVLFDVVMNHPGYATGADLVEYLPEVIDEAAFANFQPTAPRGYVAWNDLVDYQSQAWLNWWGNRWIRAGFPGHNQPGQGDLLRSLAYLPDFMTEDTRPIPSPSIPPIFSRKTDTGVVEQEGFNVRQYLVKWHTDWVREYGIDGFRCDTAKHVELASWAALKDAGVAALAEWKAANPSKKLDDAPFWMTGEVFPHGVVKDSYFTEGKFDSVINFDFQQSMTAHFESKTTLVEDVAALDEVYSTYATALTTEQGFDVLSYLSSHDTELFFASVDEDVEKMKQAGTALLLVPGGAQIFYGDESARPRGPRASDAIQGTRSDMNWASMDAGLLAHWQKLGNFRKRHAAIGAGTHEKLDSPAGTYAFGRKLSANGVDDQVVVVITAPEAN